MEGDSVGLNISKDEVRQASANDECDVRIFLSCRVLVRSVASVHFIFDLYGESILLPGFFQR